jgi:hypothetical protein
LRIAWRRRDGQRARAAAGPQSQDLLDLMAQGKTQTDLGNYEAAIRALDAIVARPDAGGIPAGGARPPRRRAARER